MNEISVDFHLLLSSHYDLGSCICMREAIELYWYLLLVATDVEPPLRIYSLATRNHQKTNPEKVKRSLIGRGITPNGMHKSILDE